MAKAIKLPSGNWRVRIYDHTEMVNGKKKKIYVSFTASTRAEAVRQAAEFSTKKKVDISSLTVGEAVDRYIEAKRAVLSPSTVRGYTTTKNLMASISGIRVKSLDSARVQLWISQLSESRKTKTVRNAYGLLTAALGMFSDVSFKVTLPQKEVIERNIPTDTQVSLLMQEAKKDPELYLAIILASQGTLRRGEICALKHKDVLRDFNALYIHADIVKGTDGWHYKEAPKTDSSVRRVSLSPSVIALIPKGEPDEYIFSFVTPSALGSRFNRLRDRLGFKCRFHDLRHYAASIMHAIGIPDQYIMAQGGWASDNILKSVYRNTLADKSAYFNEKAAEYFDEKLNEVIRKIN